MSAVNLSHPVAHITQEDEHYCWACALAMVLGRRSWAAALEVADRCPAGARNPRTGALVDLAGAARALHLTRVSAAGLTPAALARRMRAGAAAVFGRYDTGDGEFDHVMVVTLLRGDTADPGAVTVGVHDPYASGTRWTGRWDHWCGPGRVLRRPDWVVGR